MRRCCRMEWARVYEDEVWTMGNPSPKGRNHMIEIEINADSMGGWFVRPADRDLRMKIRKYMKDNGYDGAPEVYIELSQNINAFADSIGLDNEDLELISNGWTCECEMDGWEFLQGYVGYDAGDRMDL